MSDDILDQAEIDALLRMAGQKSEADPEAGAPETEASPEAPASEAAAVEEAETEEAETEPEAGVKAEAPPEGASETGPPAPEPETGETADEELVDEYSEETLRLLTKEEEDALGEVGNIAMGAAATTLSALLSHRVSITSPTVRVTSRRDLVGVFNVPYLVVNIRYTEGLEAGTLLVIQVRDAAVIADLMMGNDGSSPAAELDELGISAASEAMNQMIGASATSLASLVGRAITISPPEAIVMQEGGTADAIFAEFEGAVVTVSFAMKIGDLVDTEIMQIMTVETAREEAALLWRSLVAPEPAPAEGAPAVAPGAGAVAAAQGVADPASPPETTAVPGEPVAPTPPAPAAEAAEPVPAAAPARPAVVDKQKLDLILDIPLKVTVILGRTRRPIQEVLSMAPGAIVELATLADEPVEILVNGVMVARGEVVVVNENFGVRITSISSPRQRMQQLYGGA